jgi:hypothetical protein
MKNKLTLKSNNNNKQKIQKIQIKSLFKEMNKKIQIKKSLIFMILLMKYSLV